MKHFASILFILPSLWIVVSCTAATPPVERPLVTVYSTSAAQPWLPELYECAGTTIVVSRVDDPATADLALRIGEPDFLSSPAFQIDTEEILIVTHRQSPIQNMTADEARALFSGFGDPSVQVWVYAPGEDIQEVFERLVMEGEAITPSAHLAANPQQMSDTLISESNSVGILPRHWKVGDSREVLSVGTIPVLAIPREEPQGSVREIIACLQK